MDIVAALIDAVGDDCVRTADAIDPRRLGDFMVACDAANGPVAVALPRNTAAVSSVLRLCNRANVAVVPQGGMTGMAGGGTPIRGCVALSLERMNAIEEVDTDGATMTVQAGVPLQTVQEAAEAAGLFYPLDLGGRGSCLIGGNASTNAGGNRVVRYGMTRDLVLGVEAVLADGTVIPALNRMIKNNTGYDIKHLFLGSEGTLGVITRLVLRLFPRPASQATALCALTDFPQVLALLRLARERLGGTLSAFEAMWPEFYALVEKATGRPAPLAPGHGLYVLLETMGTDQGADQERFEAVIAAALEKGIVADALIAQSLAQTRAMWTIRDSSGEFPRTFWPHEGFDVSVPIGRIGDFVAAVKARLRARWPDAQVVTFGHVADGNIHFAVRVDERPLPRTAIEQTVYAVVCDWHGSISAEHGIGSVKRGFLEYSRSASELALMRTLKAAMDPNGILNPGKVL